MHNVSNAHAHPYVKAFTLKWSTFVTARPLLLKPAVLFSNTKLLEIQEQHESENLFGSLCKSVSILFNLSADALPTNLDLLVT